MPLRALLDTRRGAYVAVSVVGLIAALALGVGFSTAVLVGMGCGIVAQQLADERWLSRRGREDAGVDPADQLDRTRGPK